MGQVCNAQCPQKGHIHLCHPEAWHGLTAQAREKSGGESGSAEKPGEGALERARAPGCAALLLGRGPGVPAAPPRRRSAPKPSPGRAGGERARGPGRCGAPSCAPGGRGRARPPALSARGPPRCPRPRALFGGSHPDVGAAPPRRAPARGRRRRAAQPSRASRGRPQSCRPPRRASWGARARDPRTQLRRTRRARAVSPARTGTRAPGFQRLRPRGQRRAPSPELRPPARPVAAGTGWSRRRRAREPKGTWRTPPDAAAGDVGAAWGGRGAPPCPEPVPRLAPGFRFSIGVSATGRERERGREMRGRAGRARMSPGRARASPRLSALDVSASRGPLCFGPHVRVSVPPSLRFRRSLSPGLPVSYRSLSASVFGCLRLCLCLSLFSPSVCLCAAHCEGLALCLRVSLTPRPPIQTIPPVSEARLPPAGFTNSFLDRVRQTLPLPPASPEAWPGSSPWN